MESILETIENSNLNVSEIAKFHKVHRDEVIKVLIDNEYYSFKENPNARLDSAKRLRKASKLFIKIGCENTTITKVSEEVGLHKTKLRKYLETYYPNVQLDRVQYNENVFDIIDTEEKAYWLGFMYADGFISTGKGNKYRIELQLAAEDKKHLEKFCKFLEYNGEPKLHLTKKAKNEDIYYESYRVQISNKHLWTSLIEKGCTAQKSLTLTFPDKSIFTNKTLIRHFIRGYFDGDGSIGIYGQNVISGNKKYYYENHNVLYFLGTEDMLKNIVKYIGIPKNVILRSASKLTKNDLYNITYVRNQAFIASYYMYNNTTVFLDRKYKKYLEFCRLYEESYKELETKIGEGCDISELIYKKYTANPEVISEITKGLETP